MFINILFTGCQLELVRSTGRLASPFLTLGLNQGRVRTLEFFKFHDFFDDLFQFSITCALAVFFEKFKTSLVLTYLFYLKQFNKNKLWYPPKWVPFALFNFSSLSYVTLALSSAVTNLPNKTIIFHDFQRPTIKFHDFPGLEMKFLISTTFQVFHDLYEPSRGDFSRCWFIAF